MRHAGDGDRPILIARLKELRLTLKGLGAKTSFINLKARTSFLYGQEEMAEQLIDEHQRKNLATEIREFLDKHALMSAQEPDQYSSPDASLMLSTANCIEQGLKVRHIWSDWGSGGYSPYEDSAAKEWHDNLVEKIRSYQ